ncbi:MDR family MFS transporter [Sandaracinus amylolyticus]|uniref:Drug resistance transporter, EmrB/QacA family n=1 Tax=Sandaracinus amylolyticus TaxID=927083 RepID=A0A0F6SI36_9BACT|nr:MDR family MFS transporter [Sandaracinus amylolyticus]AKF11509.1 drug resistance transporter, EmrB/QacA family [Sandaracinus amylolyticus]
MKASNRPLTVAALLLSMFMAAMEATVVATAMPTVISELGGIRLYGWVGAAYLLASTVTVPLYGKLADRRGRKPVLLLGIALFLAGSLASGLATSIEQLIVFRGLQGLGAGAVQPIVLTVIGDLYTPAERGKVQGFFGAVWGIAGISGPLIGGAIVATTTWRWIFLINIPFGIAAALVLAFAYREAPRERAGAPLDLAGASTILFASLALLLAASGVAPVLMTIAGVALIALFVVIERRASDPVLPIPLMTRRLIAVTTIASFLLGVAMMGVLTYLPLHVQGVLLGVPTEAGLVIAPMLVGWPIASAMTSRMLVRTGYRKPVWLGALLSAVGLVALAPLVTMRAHPLALAGSMFVFGFGMGLANTAILIGVQASVGWEQRGVVTAATMFARTMGGALGVGALGAVLAARLGRALSPEVVSRLLDPEGRDIVLAQPGVIDALGDALDPLFWGGAIAAGLSLITVLAHPRDEQPPPATAVEAPALAE